MVSHGGMGFLSVTQFSTAYKINGQFTEEWSFKPDLQCNALLALTQSESVISQNYINVYQR